MFVDDAGAAGVSVVTDHLSPAADPTVLIALGHRDISARTIALQQSGDGVVMMRYPRLV